MAKGGLKALGFGPSLEIRQFVKLFLTTLSLCAALMASESALAGGICRYLLQLATGSVTKPNDDWKSLREKSLLVDQYTDQDRGNLCSAACSINIAQAVAGEMGLAPFSNPKEILKDFVQKNVKGHEGMSISDTVRGLRDLFQQVFSASQPKVSAIQLEGTNDDSAAGVKSVNSFKPVDLKPQPGEFKLLMFANLDSQGRLVGQHANVIAEVRQGQMILIEPANPYVEITVQQNGFGTINGVSVPKFIYTSNAHPVDSESFMPFGVVTVHTENFY